MADNENRQIEPPKQEETSAEKVIRRRRTPTAGADGGVSSVPESVQSTQPHEIAPVRKRRISAAKDASGTMPETDNTSAVPEKTAPVRRRRTVTEQTGEQAPVRRRSNAVAAGSEVASVRRSTNSGSGTEVAQVRRRRADLQQDSSMSVQPRRTAPVSSDAQGQPIRRRRPVTNENAPKRPPVRTRSTAADAAAGKVPAGTSERPIVRRRNYIEPGQEIPAVRRRRPAVEAGTSAPERRTADTGAAETRENAVIRAADVQGNMKEPVQEAAAQKKSFKERFSAFGEKIKKKLSPDKEKVSTEEGIKAAEKTVSEVKTEKSAAVSGTVPAEKKVIKTKKIPAKESEQTVSAAGKKEPETARKTEEIIAPEDKKSRQIGVSEAVPATEKKTSKIIKAVSEIPEEPEDKASGNEVKSSTLLPARNNASAVKSTQIASKPLGGTAVQKKSKKISAISVPSPVSVPVTADGKMIKQTSQTRFIWKRTCLRLLAMVFSMVISFSVVGFIGYKGYNYVMGHYFEPKDKNSTEEIEIIIDKHDSLKTISKKLEEAGIINNATIFKYYVDFSDMSSKLLAGKFKLSPSMTYDEIINQLKRRSAAKTSTKVLIVEGTLIKEMEEKFLQEDVLTSTAIFDGKATTGQDYSKYWFIKEVLDKESIQEEHRIYALEGYLFPDTYDFYIHGDADGIITRMLDRFSQIYTQEYKERAASLGMTTDNVVTLASIIEKEGGNVEDFKKISAVFHNRLYHSNATDHKLQSDATHQYFMPEKKFVWTAEELKIESPYNTYIHPGLPIGPICNPGKAAIEAALYPDEEVLKEKYLYFVAADLSKGEILYAKTYEEHLKNVEYARQFWPDS